MEATKYVEINETGSAVIYGTRIHVETVAQAHANGFSEDEILAWLNINKVQFHGALAYYYEHQDEIEQRLTNRLREVDSVKNISINTLEKLRNRRAKE